MRKSVRTVVPQDGEFHLDNQVLEERGQLNRKARHRRLMLDLHMVRRLKERVDVAVPTFDRTRDIFNCRRDRSRQRRSDQC
jgi:pantothenate kinase